MLFEHLTTCEMIPTGKWSEEEGYFIVGPLLCSGREGENRDASKTPT